ncbi:SRPBCC family protein [Mycobacterium deserti]|uniref:SRPBCC domain-containing protein n=1 Tax=Mycobacterium deserti TaxID=2978347 RepID=A0ABT2MCK5_9MYCO|nr:SRPBCC domain-containing protein [Mycobacterium deserti]MCT7660003.1 SRPBCC domain-containing protein [Mycobacterium deserti]
MNETPVVRVRRVMPAAPEEVFDQWLDPESLADWMCPRPVRVVALTIEPRVGGSVQFDIDDAGTRVLITGRFLEIDRPHRLRFTWSASDFPDPTAVSVVDVAFEPLIDGQTLMSIEHSLLPPNTFDEYHSGWAGVAGQLAEFLQGRANG